MKKIITLFLALAINAQADCNPAMQRDKPNNVYLDNLDGTVTDQQTGLMWQRCSVGQVFNQGDCEGVATTQTWQSALHSAQTANSAEALGYDDWRLPNMKELASLVDFACYSPAINSMVFPATPAGSYWTASPCGGADDCAWFVGFTSGSSGTYFKNLSFRARLVRDVD